MAFKEQGRWQHECWQCLRMFFNACLWEKNLSEFIPVYFIMQIVTLRNAHQGRRQTDSSFSWEGWEWRVGRQLGQETARVCSSQIQEWFALVGLGNKRGGQVDQIDHSTKMPYSINSHDSKKKGKKGGGAYGKETLWSFSFVTLETAALSTLKLLFCVLFKKKAKHDLGSAIVGTSSMYVN